MNVFIYDWTTYELPNITETHAIGLNLDSKKILLRFDFLHFGYINIPTNIKLSKNNEDTLLEEIRTLNIPDIQVSILMAKTIYGYQPEPRKKFIIISTKTKKRFSEVKKIFEEGFNSSLGRISGELLEYSVSSGRKLTALQDIKLCGWVKIDIDSDNVRIINDNKLANPDVEEYAIEWTSLKQCEESEEITRGWRQSPDILSFDIETYQPSARLGMPDPESKENVIFFISMIFQKVGNPESRRYYSLVLGDYNATMVDSKVNILRSNTEKDLLINFIDLIIKYKPLYIIGFNTHLWDWKYINIRKTINKLKWPENMGIYANQRPKMKDYDFTTSNMRTVVVHFLDIPGIIVFDIHKYFLRKKTKLQKYSLDFVSKYYLGRGKHSMSQVRMVSSYEKYFETNYHKDDSEAMNMMGEVASYNLEDSVLVLDMFEKLGLYYELRTESEDEETTIPDLYNKGVQIRAFSSIYRKAKTEGFIVNKLEMTDEKIRGGFVFEPTRGLHLDIGEFDISSSYPNIMIEFNICYSTWVDSGLAKHMNQDHLTKLQYVTETATRDIYFIKKEIFTGISVSIAEEKLSQRKKIKKTLSNVTDPFVIQLLTDSQNTLKMTINSMIGMMGTPYKISKLPFPGGFGVITTLGRELLGKIINLVTESDKVVVYGDTDSVFVKTPGENIFNEGKKLEKYINDKIYPFQINHEYSGHVLILEKKNYIAWPVNPDGVLKSEANIIYKGIEIARRNTCAFACDSLKKIIKNVLIGAERGIVYDIILDSSIDLLENIISLKNLTSSIHVGKDYVSESSFANVLAIKERSKGREIYPGDLLEYVVIKESGKKSLGSRSISPEEFLERKGAGENLELDKEYYLSRLQNCVDKIFSIVYVIDKKEDKEDQYLNIMRDKGISDDISNLMCKTEHPIKDLILLLKKGKLTIDTLKDIRTARRSANNGLETIEDILDFEDYEPGLED